MSRATFLVITCLCGLALVAWLVFLLYKWLSEDRDKGLRFIRNFKKGVFTIPLIPAYVLFLISKLVDVESPQIEYVTKSALESLASTVSLMGLRFDFDKLERGMALSQIFKFVTYFCFIIVVVNVFLFAASLFLQRFHFWNHSRWRRSINLFKVGNDVCFIYGNNERSLKIYDTYDHSRKRFIIDDFAGSGNEDLFFKGVSYSNYMTLEEEKNILKRYLYTTGKKDKIFWKTLRFIRKGLRIILRRKKEMYGGKLFIIVNYEDDKKNIEFCQQLIKTIDSAYNENNEQQFENMVKGLMIYVFGDNELDSIYQGIEEESYGCLRYYNKYKMMGIDLMKRFPITHFMDKKQINYKKAALRRGVRMTFSMIGFGKTNRRLFNNLVSDVQFNIEDDKGYSQYIPEFYLYDHNESLYTSDLNHNYFRYVNFLENTEDTSKYLELPPLPANLIMFPKCDVRSPSLYKNMKENLKTEKTDVNFVYVAFGTDLQNIEFAKKLYDKRVEWGIPNLFIFVKVNSINHDTATEMLKEKDNKDRLIPFGENDIVYSFRNVISDFDYNMAQKVDSYHATIDEKYIKKKPKPVAKKRWFNGDTYEFDRLSSLATAVSFYNKLGLLGLEIADKGDSISKEEFDKRYNKNARQNLAESQHLRWNAYMICNGYIPSTREQIEQYKTKNKKKLKKKREVEHMYRNHCNLTTIKGMHEYIKLTEDKGVLEHDSMMDICYESVHDLGKVIVKKGQ